MARKQNSAREQQKARADVLPTHRKEVYTAEYAGYLVCDLNANHEKALEKHVLDAPSLFAWLQEMVDSGYKLVLTYSKDGASVRAELHDMDKDSDLAGWRLSSFAEDVHDALLVLHFKHTQILSGDWSLASRERSARRFG